MGFFSSLGSKISNGVNFLGNKVADGAQWLGSKVGSIGDSVSNLAARAAPVLATINPELGALAGSVAGGAKLASGFGHAISHSINDYRENPVRRLGDHNLFN
jgi:hypothetical protein